MDDSKKHKLRYARNNSAPGIQTNTGDLLTYHGGPGQAVGQLAPASPLHVVLLALHLVLWRALIGRELVSAEVLDKIAEISRTFTRPVV